MAPLRWGVLGVSQMVGRLAVLPALQRSPHCQLVAVASRDVARARAEVERFGGLRAYGDYQALLADDAVEAVYVPLPNGLHGEWAARAAAAGKHVLCEKPLACNEAEGRAMDAACRQAGVHLMEAYATPFHARSQRLRALLQAGTLGALRFAHTAFTFRHARPADHRWVRALGGGSLLDLGVYVLAPLVEAGGGLPRECAAAQVVDASGVDRSFSGWLSWGDGFTASFQTSFEAPERQWLQFVGTEGAVTVEHGFTPNQRDTDLVFTRPDGATEALTGPANDPYLAMVEHFVAVVRGRAPQQRPVGDSLAMLGLLDRLRAIAAGHALPGAGHEPRGIASL